MDLTSTTSASTIVVLRLKNFIASAAVVWVACVLYRVSPQNYKHLEAIYRVPTFSFSGAGFLFTMALIYSALLGAYFLTEQAPRASKSLRFFHVIAAFIQSPVARWHQGMSGDDRVAVLATVLKAFFAPMMAVSLMQFCMGFLANGAGITSGHLSLTDFRTLFDRHGFWFLFQLILFIDVLIFTLGYLVELPRLRNEIRSVDPTLLGWVAALLCYPPFNAIPAAILGSKVSDFPTFDNPTAHLALNLTLLALMAVYTSASVALGFKASNLTHRGIVSRGPYAFVRHPAYTCKNMAWWIGAIPLVSAAFVQSLLDGALAVASVVGWSMLYMLRAVTEEDHLRSVDDEYAAYAAKVRYRFIPGVI